MKKKHGVYAACIAAAVLFCELVHEFTNINGIG